MSAYRFGFLLEQTLGHVTHTANLRRTIGHLPDVTAEWGLVPYDVSGAAARIPLYKSNWTVRAGLRTRRILTEMARSGPLNALFFHTQTVAALAADWISRIPSVVSLDATPRQMDELGAFYNHAVGSAPVEQAKQALYTSVLNRARAVVTWSGWARDGVALDYGVPSERISVIPPGVTVEDWAPPQPRALHAGPVKLLFVGGDFERKGGTLLLDAWRALRHHGVELHVVTRTALPSEPGLLVYHDMQPNSPALRTLYHQSDIFVLPTSGDCLPMVLMEAGAAALPLISTSVAAIPEIVRDGQTGLLIRPNDPAALTAALERLVLQPELRLDLGRRAADLVSREYQARRNAERLVELLRETANRPEGER